MIENSTIKDHYIKIQELYNNVVNILTAINQSFQTSSSEVSVTFLDSNSITQTVSKYAKHYKVKSRNMTTQTLNLIIELRTAQGKELLQDVMAIESITSASLLNHDGEVTF